MTWSFEANAKHLVGMVLRDRYKLLELLGAGGMGAVFRAMHIHLETIRAVKVMLSEHGDDPSIVKRFLREARGLARLNHPNVVSVVDTGTTESGLPFIAMEFLEGEALSATLKRDGPLSWSIVKHIAGQICAALHAAHEMGIVHRDVKPDNCFRAYDNSDGYFIKLLDFGIAKFQNDQMSKLTQTGSIMGTLPYMSYEQICGQACDRQSDIWSTAVMFYELLTGVLPFRGNNMGQLSYAIVQHEPTPVSQVRPELKVPPQLNPILARAMAKKKEDRFTTMMSFFEALKVVPDPIGYATTAPFLHPGRVGDEPAPESPVPQTQPWHGAAELPPDSPVPQTQPWHGAAVSNIEEDIEALAKGELTFDSKSVRPVDFHPEKNRKTHPHHRRPSLMLILLSALVSVLTIWAIVQGVRSSSNHPTDKKVAGQIDPSPLTNSKEGTQTSSGTQASNRVEADSGDESSFSPLDDPTSLATTQGSSQTSPETGGPSENSPEVPSSPPTEAPEGDVNVPEPKRSEAGSKPVVSKTKKRKAVLNCNTIKKARATVACLKSCNDCTPPIRVRSRGAAVIVLGTNKSAISANGKSLNTCLQDAVGNMRGVLSLDGTCELSK